MKQGEKFVLLKDKYDTWGRKASFTITTREQREAVRYEMLRIGETELAIYQWDIESGSVKTNQVFRLWKEKN